MRWLPIHDLDYALRPNQLHCYCFMLLPDVTLSPLFAEREKSAQQTLEIFDDVTEVFERLSRQFVLVSEAEMMELIEAFVVVMYNRTTTTFDINE